MLRGMTRKMAVIGATLVAFVAMPAIADEVILKNGDRITGTLVELAGGKLSIKTEYAGTVEIDWAQVDTFSTDAPVYVKVGDNLVRATVVAADDGTASLSSEDLLDAEPIELSRLSEMSYEKKPAVRVTGRANLGASSSSGNTNTENLVANAELVARSAHNRFVTGGRINKAKTEGTQTESNWLVYLKYDHFITAKWYATGNMDAENDKFKDINLRTTIGVGSGYQFFETDITELAIELGVNYVNTDFITGVDSDYPAARWGLDYSHKLFGTDNQFFHRDELFVALDDSDNLFLRTATGFRLPIVAGLNSTIQYNFDYDDNPAPGRVKEDKMWLVTLGYRW